MPINQENINRWIDQANIDYIGHFIKAWIPFNAWYSSNYPTFRTDRQKINAIKNDPNTVRNGINSFMETNSQMSLEFKSHLATLIYQLEENQITGSIGRISFNNVLKEQNPNNQKNVDFGRNKYFLRRTDTAIIGVISSFQINVNKLSDNSSVFSYTHTEYDLEHLQNYPSYQTLGKQVKDQLRIYFQELKPFETVSILQDDVREHPMNYYLCDSYHVRRDVANPNCYAHLVVRSLIEILYQLRNVLFHGELVPNLDAQKVYNSAYHLLKMILEKIR